MFDIGFWELALIAILALVLLGPKRLPEAARAAGYWLGRARRFIASARSELDQHMQSGDMEELRRLKEELNETRRYIQEVAGQTRDDFTRTLQEAEALSENSIGNTEAGAASKRIAKKPSTRKASGTRKGKAGAGRTKKAAKKAGKKSSKKKTAKKSPSKRKS